MGFEHLPFWSYNLQFQMLNHYATMAEFPLENKQWYIFNVEFSYDNIYVNNLVIY